MRRNRRPANRPAQTHRYKKSTVFLTEIVPDNQIKYDFLDKVDGKKHVSLMETMDKLSFRYGRDIVKVAT
jgi:DNA polymerase V